MDDTMVLSSGAPWWTHTAAWACPSGRRVEYQSA